MSAQDRAAIMRAIHANTVRTIAVTDEQTEALAHEVARDASDRAPVKKGTLRDSFLGGPDGVAPDGVRRDPGPDQHDRQTFTVGSALAYASTIEHEHTPMLRPALNERAHELPRRVAAAIRRQRRAG